MNTVSDAAPPPVYSGDAALFDSIDIDGPIAGLDEQDCAFFEHAYRGASRNACAANANEVAAGYDFLAVIASFHSQFDDLGNPYRPAMVMGDRRSAIPGDLQPSDIDAIRRVGARTGNVAFKARANDLIWLLAKDHKACRVAAESYFAAGVSRQGSWTHSVKHFKRGLHLARQLGARSQLHQEIVAGVLQEMRRALNHEPSNYSEQLLRLLLATKAGDPSELVNATQRLAQTAEDQGDMMRVSSLRSLEADFHAALHESEKERAARVAAANAIVAIAEASLKGPSPSYLAAVHWLKQGIEGLRRAGEDQDRIKELRGRLAEYQRLTLAEMKPILLPDDMAAELRSSLEQAREAAEKHVSGHPFVEALFRLAFVHPLVDVPKLKDIVLDGARQAPLSHLFNAAHVDAAGRATTVAESLLDKQGEEFERVLEQHCFKHAAQHVWIPRALNVIEPARAVVQQEHQPSLDDLMFIVANSPFVPPGREGIFLRGLHAGLHGDWTLAAHLLIPQLENSLRFVVEQSGSKPLTKLRQSGTEELKMLRPLLEMDATRKMFCESWIFELRGCLIEPLGFALRDRLAHGLLDERDFYSAPPMTAWWLTLRLCLEPIYIASPDDLQGLANRPRSHEAQGEQENSDGTAAAP